MKYHGFRESCNGTGSIYRTWMTLVAVEGYVRV